MNRWTELTFVEMTALLVFIPGFFLILSVLRQTGMPLSAAFVIWGTIFFYTTRRNATWPCPRCGKWFHGLWFDRRRRVFRRMSMIRFRCANCGVRRGDPRYT
jgi:hypothetical protein